MSGTVLAIVAEGGKRLALGDRIYEYGPGQYLVASVDLPVTGHFAGAGPGNWQNRAMAPQAPETKSSTPATAPAIVRASILRFLMGKRVP